MHTLTDVIAALSQLVEEAKTQNARSGYFASLYLQMTRAVKNGVDNNAFEDSPRMEKLVVIFAGRYVDAYQAWKNGQPCSSSWQIAFEETRNNRISVLQHVLCGINAHINLDLSIAASETMQNQPLAPLHNDFNRINEVIGSLAQEFQEKINTLSWPMRFVDNIGKENDEAVANFSITMARDAAWASANALHVLPANERSQYMLNLDKATHALAQKIIYPGFWPNLLFRLVKWFEPAEPSEVLAVLNNG